MPNDGFVQLQPDSSGKSVDTSELTVSGRTVERQRVVLSDDAGAANVAAVTAANALKVDGSAVTQPVSVATVPLPTGAATAAKQAALGTAGSASADVISVQGVASMTALKVDGSGVTQPVSGTVTANPAAVTTGGASPYSYISAGTSNQDSQVAKNGAGQLYALYLTNINAAVRYVKIYDKATGPTSSDTPVLRLAVPGNAAGAGGAVPIPPGCVFANGISIRITTGSADNDTGAAATGDVLVNLFYK